MTQPPIKLYTTLRSPYARKVRIAMHEKGLAFDEEIVDLEHRSESFKAASLAGTVPTLAIGGEQPINLLDSTLILQYLESEFPRPSLQPRKHHDRWQMWNLEELADRVAEYQIKVFFEQRKPQPDAAVIEKSNARSEPILRHIETRLVNAKYLMGSYSIADIAMGSALLWMTFRLGTNWETRPIIGRWLHRLSERESFVRTVPRLS